MSKEDEYEKLIEELKNKKEAKKGLVKKNSVDKHSFTKKEIEDIAKVIKTWLE